jgi:hypothetical protein
MDMCFHWLRDRECQEQFRIYWRPDKLNYADYWTKHHLAKHHKNARQEFLTSHIVIKMLRMEQKQKQTKAMDMHFHWLRDRECQEQFRIYWRPGKANYADYWTKHHPTAHHQNTRKEFLTPLIVLEMLRQEQHAAAAAA